MRRLPAPPLVAVLVLAAALVAACESKAPAPVFPSSASASTGSPASNVPSAPGGSAAPASIAPATATPSQPADAIVSVESRGGECASGLCTHLLNIEADGHIHQVIPKDEVLATVPVELIDALQVEVERANYRLIRSRPFTGTCPTAYDGQETIYTFHVSSGDQVIDSCKVAIDPKHPLFQAVGAALAGVTP